MEEDEGRLMKKIKENPLMPIGIIGMLVSCGIGAYKFNKRGEMSPSVFLMHLRVTAQGAVVGTLTLSVVYHLVKKHILKQED